MSTQQDASSSDTAQAEGEGPDGSSDKPPSANSHAVPLPPPESGTYYLKQPGHTAHSLEKLVTTPADGQPATADNSAANGHLKKPSVASVSSGSSPSSPVGSEPSDWGSAPSTRPPSQPPSRAPSMSSAKKFFGLSKLMSGDDTPKQSHTAASPAEKRSGNKSSSTPASPAVSATPMSANFDAPNSASTSVTVRGKAPSVHSQDGRDSGGHKFNLKDLLGATAPKLTRRASQRSTSSRRSDTDRESVAEGGKARSVAGESTGSLSQKYGVCQKVAIGKGATSVVRLAHKWDRSEEKLYAVKEFRKRRKNETEKDYVKKLTAEFCISSTLHHINVVETVDLVQDENMKWCEVMEFCPGGDLYAAIKKGGMSPSEVECCFKQILTGVNYLHSQGVAHRDIKPENLFFDTQGHLKIGDYGASTVYRLPWEATVHMSTGLCGSEPYIAPEQFLSKPYDARLVDIWACGIVYYCLHFQELPWRAAQSTDTLYTAYATACASSSHTQSSCPPTINNLSPRACRSLIRRMLEPNPKNRALIEEVMKHPWIGEIEVCHTVENPKHVHVHARALAQAQLKEIVRD